MTKPTEKWWSAFAAGVAVGFMLAAVGFALSGCERTTPYPPGYSETTVTESFTDGGSLDEVREATGTGAGLQTGSGDVAANWKAGTPTAGLDGSTGGETAFTLDLSAAGGTRALLIAGIIALVGAGAAFWFRLTRAALALAVLGAVLIGGSFYPALFLWGLAVAGVAGLWFVVQSDWGRVRFKEALRATVAGVETLPDDERKAVKSSIGVHADEADRKTIRAAKQADGFGGER